MRLIVLLLAYAGIKFTTQSRSCTELLGHKNCHLLPEDNQCGRNSRSELFPWMAIAKTKVPDTETLAEFVGRKNRSASQIRQFGSKILEEEMSRIVVGENARLGQFPWMAMLIDKDSVKPFECGGSLINKNYVVTAAHCLDYVNTNSLWIRLGEHNLKTNPDCSPSGECAPQPQNIKVVKIIIPKGYCYKTLRDDIALLRLQRPAKYNKYVSPICMPISTRILSQEFEKYPVDVAGWGEFKRPMGYPDILQTTVLHIFPLRSCNGTLGTDTVTDKQMCTMGSQGRDSCPGDSGGPVMSYFEDFGISRYFLTGVVSYGKGDCGRNQPGVNTRVSAYNTWILNNMVL